MRYREFQPHPALQTYIECYWAVYDDSQTSRIAAPILPDGSLEIILNLGGPQLLDARRFGQSPDSRCYLFGQQDRYVLLTNGRRIDYLGIRFRPAGAYRFVGVNVDKLRAQVLELGAVLPSLQRELLNGVDPRGPLSARIHQLDRILLGHLKPVAKQDLTIEAAVDLAVRKRGNVQVSEILAALGVGARQLERKFNRAVGIGPKLFCRVLRFKSIYEAARQSPIERWAAAAFACGYYDQSHLIRDFLRFSGTAPAVLFSKQWYSEHSRLTFLQRKLLPEFETDDE
ncbi:MAG: AraC family transcriptional regulator [Acidobacteria bacterium]|nr:AraC family transcriptional regulator [Acidobacteriota bacterium]